MPLYLWQGAYAPEAWATLVERPENRIAAVRPAVEKLGGKIRNAFFSFGEYDVILIVEMPDNVSAAALSMAIAAGGPCKAGERAARTAPPAAWPLAAPPLTPAAAARSPSPDRQSLSAVARSPAPTERSSRNPFAVPHG